MKLKLSVILALTCLATISCSSTPIRQASGTRYTSKIPPLDVEFAYRIGDVQDYGNDKYLDLSTTDVRGIWVDLIHLQVNDNQIDYFYSLQNIVNNYNFKHFGLVYFNNHQWAKVVKYNDEGWLMCGFFTRKDKWLIFIHNSARLTNAELQRYREYQKTLKLVPSRESYVHYL